LPPPPAAAGFSAAGFAFAVFTAFSSLAFAFTGAFFASSAATFAAGLAVVALAGALAGGAAWSTVTLSVVA
jgi:hypothetical protein